MSAAGVVLGAALAAKAMRSRRRMDLHGRVALLAGGSRGLGLVLARQLGREGMRLAVAARDEAELERARQLLRDDGVEVEIFQADVSNPDEASQLVDRVVDRFGRIDVLVNNAGVITVGPLEHMAPADFEESIGVHFRGPLHTMMAAIPHMRRQGGGRIVNVSSIGGKIGVPHLATYCAGKFALTGVSTSIRPELEKDGILVTTVSPGLMRTGSVFNARFKGRHRDEFTWFAISDSLPFISVDAGRAAAKIVDAMRYGDAECVISWPAKLAVVAEAVVPGVVAAAMHWMNWILPDPGDASGDQQRSGWQSLSAWAPSWLTRLSEKPAAANNELPA